jgi:hypothetical protein
LAGVYLLLARSWLDASLSRPVRDLGEQLATQAKALVYYVDLIVLPSQLSVEHPFVLARWAVLAIASVGWLLRKWSTGLLFAAWAVLPLLPASLVPLNVLVNEHRLYLPLAFLGVGLGWVLKRGLGKGQRVLVAWSLIALASLSYERCLVWQSELSLWSDALGKAPNAYRAHLHLGGPWKKPGVCKRHSSIMTGLLSWRRQRSKPTTTRPMRCANWGGVKGPLGRMIAV